MSGRTMQTEIERLRARIAELEHPRSYLPPGVERAEAVYAANVLATEQERDAWRARAEFAERERAVLRARLVACRPWVGVCPWPGTPAWSEVIAARELADDTLEEIKP